MKCKFQKTTVYYVQKSYRKDDGKTATKYVEKLGSLSDLISRFGEKDPIGSAKAYVAELTEKEKKDREEINIKLKQLHYYKQILSTATTAVTYSYKRYITI